MSDKYAALKQAAEVATQGPWRMDHENIWHCDEEGNQKHLMYLYQGDDVDDRQDHDNTAFIALCNPATILALLAEREADKARIAELESLKVTLPSLNPQMFNDDVMFGYRKAQKEAVEFCAAAGITLETGERS